MGTHLYFCEAGGDMILAVDGTPPKWATCPVCVTSLECTTCKGAELRGEAPPFPIKRKVLYRCSKGHERTIAMATTQDERPESANCPDCDEMLLPVG